MALPDGAAAIWAVVARFTALDATGAPDTGAPSVATNQFVKLTLNPVVSTGDDIEQKNAGGDLVAWGKHGDIPKYATATIDIGTVDPYLEFLLNGGTLLSAAGSALGAPSTPAAVAQATLGQLAAGVYGYVTTQYNAYGESTPTAGVTATTTGSTGTVVVTPAGTAAGALGTKVYGRTPGGPQLLGTVPNFATQATSAASGTGGAITSLSVTALTAAIPLGTTFQIAGDTNTTKIVFTTTAFAPVGAVTVQVSPSQSITTTIAAANIVPVFVDNGTVSVTGAVSPPNTDTTAGPGAYTGYQAPALGSVAAPNGVSCEIWSKAIRNGFQDPTYPYWRWVFPRIANLRTTQRDFTNANVQSSYEGQAFENPSWGSGPFSDWPLSSTRYFQRARVGAASLPVPALTPVLAQA